MCIRDRERDGLARSLPFTGHEPVRATRSAVHLPIDARPAICLLYTSDAADERSSVDLGGRRIIKKKKNSDTRAHRAIKEQLRPRISTACTQQNQEKKMTKEDEQE